MGTTSRFNLAKEPKSRDVDFLQAPDHVTDHAQTKHGEHITSRKLNFDRLPRENLPERPSTSAGTSSRLPQRKDSGKRITRDDLDFNPLAVHGKGTTFYNFPLPGSVTNQDSNLKSNPPPPRKSSLPVTRPLLSGSMATTSTSRPAPEMGIGMALGSPAHPPIDWQNQTRPEQIQRTESPDTMDDIDGTAIPLRSKASKWKLLGGIFGGKKHSASQDVPFYQVQPEAMQKPEVTPSITLDSEEVPSRPKTRGRGLSVTEKKTKKGKPEAKRSQTAPAPMDLQENHLTPDITINGSALKIKDGKPKSTDQPYNGQILEVDIPSIHMERYSIMFGSVLQQATTSSTSLSSSLLARRQATLDKLKTANDELALKERELEEREKAARPRRATSPRTNSVSTFSLFPSPPSKTGTTDASPAKIRNGHGLQRSNTSPAALSPQQSTFPASVGSEPHTISISQPTNLTGPPPANYKGPTKVKKEQKTESPKSAPQDSVLLAPSVPQATLKPPRISPSQQQQPDRWSPDESQLILDSPVSDGEADSDVYDTSPLPMRANSLRSVPMKPALAEPQWQMINLPHGRFRPAQKSASSVSGSESDHSASGSTSSAFSTATTIMLEPAQTGVSSTLTSSTTPTTKKIVTIAPPTTPKTVYPPPKPIVIPPQPAPKSRQRSRTGSSSHQRQQLSEISEKSIPPSPPPTEPSVEDDEARLKSAADISIARQISVSRQQQQLLIPIRTKNLSPSSKDSSKSSLKYSENTARSMSAGLGVNRVASPLGAVAKAAAEERERSISPLAEKRDPMLERKETQRLVEGVKPSTPTLVVVPGPDKNGQVQAWGGMTAARKGKGISNASSLTGEIPVALAVSRNENRTAYQHHKDLQNRKSEQVVVERVSIDVN